MQNVRAVHPTRAHEQGHLIGAFVFDDYPSTQHVDLKDSIDMALYLWSIYFGGVIWR